MNVWKVIQLLFEEWKLVNLLGNPCCCQVKRDGIWAGMKSADVVRNDPIWKIF
jgi:hypothetical protein